MKTKIVVSSLELLEVFLKLPGQWLSSVAS